MVAQRPDVRHLNPFTAYMTGDRRILYSQAPNYSHLLYIILWPFTKLSWPQAKMAWALFNLTALGYVYWGLGRYFTLPAKKYWWTIVCALACSGAEVKLALGNGQQVLLCLAAITTLVLFESNHWIAGAALAVLMTKYSFGVFVALALVACGYLDTVAFAALISVAAWLFVSWWIHSDPWQVLLAPLHVAERDVPISRFDLSSMVRQLAKAHPAALSLGLPAIGLLDLLAFGWLFSMRRLLWRNGRFILPIVGFGVMMSLGSVYHLDYDLLGVLIGFAAWLLIEPGAPSMLTRWGFVTLAMFYWMLPRLARFFPRTGNPFDMPWAICGFALVSIGAALLLLRQTRRALLHQDTSAP